MTTTDKIADPPWRGPHGGLHRRLRDHAEQLAGSIGVPPRRINEIVHGKRGVTADTALRFTKYFGTSAEFWLNPQSHYELDRAEDRAGEQIASITPLKAV